MSLGIVFFPLGNRFSRAGGAKPIGKGRFGESLGLVSRREPISPRGQGASRRRSLDLVRLATSLLTSAWLRQSRP